MDQSLAIPFLFFAIGFIFSGLITWFYARYKLTRTGLSPSEIAAGYVPRSLHEAIEGQLDQCRDDLHEKEAEIRDLLSKNAALQQGLQYQEERLLNQSKEINALQERARLEFENLANRLLDEKSQKFAAQNQQQISDLLSPLREHIKTFEDSIDKRFREEAEGRVSLKKEIEHLRDLNQQLSQDANNLATALKGGQKTQGDWGEVQLEMLLERAGLQRDVHYKSQSSYKDDEGRQKRPDFIILLPENKHLVIDAKVSLVAYEQYYNAEDTDSRKQFLKAHIDSIRQHIKDLSSKNYQQLYHINPPDYLLLFVPLEPAFTAAIKEDQGLFTEALDYNIVIVTTSTLLATMRTVAYIWKQEKQKRSVQEMARQGGLLYDKFCAFVDDLKAIGARLEMAQGAWHDAMNKLSDSKKYGDTLIGRAERLRALGAKNAKTLPPDLLEEAGEYADPD